MVESHPESTVAEAFRQIAHALVAAEVNAATASLTIAVSVTGGKLDTHFGHCESFVVFGVDPAQKQVLQRQALVPPRHEPGVLPRWLSGPTPATTEAARD